MAEGAEVSNSDGLNQDGDKGSDLSSGDRSRSTCCESSNSRDDEAIAFVKSFIKELTKGVVKKNKNDTLTKKRKERKRQINRASAKRKRLRFKQEIDSLTMQCQKLDKINDNLMAENARLQICIDIETQKQNAYLTQIRLSFSRAAEHPQPAAPAIYYDPAQNGMLIDLLQAPNNVHELQKLIQAYHEVERVRKTVVSMQQLGNLLAQAPLVNPAPSTGSELPAVVETNNRDASHRTIITLLAHSASIRMNQRSAN